MLSDLISYMPLQQFIAGREDGDWPVVGETGQLVATLVERPD